MALADWLLALMLLAPEEPYELLLGPPDRDVPPRPSQPVGPSPATAAV
jgi:hypothetical protein